MTTTKIVFTAHFAAAKLISVEIYETYILM